VELADRRDGEWVTVGGMISQTKRIRTKKGDPMMFATLDDLDSSVELLVFGKALAESEGALVPDTIVVVRGRVDHKDRDKTCLVAQQIERFEPSPEEVQAAQEHAVPLVRTPGALRLRLDATALPSSALGELKDLLAGFPGESEVVIELTTSIGERRLRLGPDYRVCHGAALHAELDQLLGAAILVEDGNGTKTDEASPVAGEAVLDPSATSPVAVEPASVAALSRS
jgi:DNA polymerase-3 subunit alpha